VTDAEILVIPQPIYDQMLAHALNEYPKECCGLLAGRDAVATQFYRMTNTHQSSTTYFMDPKEQFAAVKDMRLRAIDLLAIYHSHPHTEAYPSATDIHLAYYPDAVYLIASLKDRSAPVLRAFRIRDGAVTETGFELRRF
jgi:proteasome lid subunit RPN8/RPN11